MKVLIVGLGYVGSALGKALVLKGHEVWGLSRQGGEPVEGVQAITADLLVPSSLKNLPLVEAVIFSQAPRDPSDTYERIYYQGTKNLLSSLRGAKKVIFLSSTSVYSTIDGAWVDEETPIPTPLSENARWLLRAEQLILKSDISGGVFRLGGIYGPGRNRLQAIAEKKWKPTLSNKYLNRIHCDDVVSGIELLLQKGKCEIYLGVDDEPTVEKAFYEWLYQNLHLPKPSMSEQEQTARRKSNKRCLNKKIKQLGLALKYPTFREGYTALLKDLS